MSWRPIETAPKDGTEIIYQHEDGSVSTCQWAPDDCGFDWYDIYGDQIAYPARWMPLPATVIKTPTMIPHDEPYFAPTSLGVLIRKNGYFYRPDWCGYTASPNEAGRYERGVAQRHAANTEGVTVHEFWEFLDAPNEH